MRNPQADERLARSFDGAAADRQTALSPPRFSAVKCWENSLEIPRLISCERHLRCSLISRAATSDHLDDGLVRERTSQRFWSIGDVDHGRADLARAQSLLLDQVENSR
jgi:hypothetical protein